MNEIVFSLLILVQVNYDLLEIIVMMLDIQNKWFDEVIAFLTHGFVNLDACVCVCVCVCVFQICKIQKLK